MKMDKLGWRTGTGSRKGPFTVDSGGGNPAGRTPPSGGLAGAGSGSKSRNVVGGASTSVNGMGSNSSSSSSRGRHPDMPSPYRSNPATPSMPSPAANSRPTFTAPAPVYAGSLPIATHASHRSHPHSREGSLYGLPDQSSVGTSSNPVTPFDVPHSLGSLYNPTLSTSFGNVHAPGTTTSSVVPPPSPWYVPGNGPPTGIPAARSSFDWTSPKVNSPLQPGQDSIDPSVFDALADLIKGTQPMQTPAPIPVQQDSTTSLLNRIMQQQQSHPNSQNASPSQSSSLGGYMPSPGTFNTNHQPIASTSQWPGQPFNPVISPSYTPPANNYTVPKPGPSRSNTGPSPSPKTFQSPFAPHRAEAPQNPAPNSKFNTMPNHAGPHSVPNFASDPSPAMLAGLPNIPPDFSIEHLAQYGSAGLEMAIRVGMGIGMSLGQQAQQQQQQHASAQTSVASGSGNTPSSVASPRPAPPKPTRNASSKSTNIVSDIMNDQLFKQPELPSASQPMSRRPSHDLANPDHLSPEEAAKKDPLATQIWKAYAQGRETLPNGARMENLTWRMMHLTLRKQEELAAQQAIKEEEAADELKALRTEVPLPAAEQERGRSAGKSRVVGFGNVESPE